LSYSGGGGVFLDSQYHETYQGPVIQEEESAEISIAQMMQLEKQYRDGANWFYWIAGLSLLTSILLAVGSSYFPAIALGIVTLSTVMGMTIPALSNVVVVPIIIAVGVLGLIGYLSNKGHSWAYLLGISLFGLDTVLLLVFMDFMGICFHALALFFIIRGYVSLQKLKKLVPNFNYAS